MSNLLQDTQKNIEKAAKILNLSKDVLSLLEKPANVIEIEILVKMDDGSSKKFPAWRVQHSNILGPYKGGIRFHQDSTLDEVKALASLMTWKTSLMGIPLGGAKGAVKVNPKELSKSDLENISRAYVRGIFEAIGPEKDIPAPDVNTDSQIMAWMYDEYSEMAGRNVPGSFTGKPVELEGSRGREIATAYGGSVVLREYLKKAPKDISFLGSDISVAIQGFGNVGSNLALILYRNGARIVALSDSKGAIYNEEGIDVAEILRIQKDKGLVGKEKCTIEQASGGKCKIISNEELLEFDVGVLIPAALEDQINQKNADKIKARVVLEMANGPITKEADEILARKGIDVLPDILVNGGGVVGSYFEWVQNMQRFYWLEEEVLARIDRVMADSFRAVAKTREEYKSTWRGAAYIASIKRVVKAMELRGVR